MKSPANYLLANERKYKNDVVGDGDCCVPDQSLSIPELLRKCQRENKPLPKAVDYDIESLDREYDDLQIPENLSREDALHLLDRTKAHMSKLQYELRKEEQTAFRDKAAKEETKSPPISPERSSQDA